MRLHKTGHPIADTVSDLIGELPDGDYNIAYGILRHDLFREQPYFEIDRGFWGADHFSGNYRISLNGTQPKWHENGPSEPHGLTLEPWREPIPGQYTLICQPTYYVCDFFGINCKEWLLNAAGRAGKPCIVRCKNTATPINWDEVDEVITFNSTVGIEALRRGIPVISDPNHSTIGSFMHSSNNVEPVNRDKLFSFCSAHQFKLGQKEKIWGLLNHYLAMP